MQPQKHTCVIPQTQVPRAPFPESKSLLYSPKAGRVLSCKQPVAYYSVQIIAMPCYWPQASAAIHVSSKQLHPDNGCDPLLTIPAVKPTMSALWKLTYSMSRSDRSFSRLIVPFLPYSVADGAECQSIMKAWPGWHSCSNPVACRQMGRRLLTARDPGCISSAMASLTSAECRARMAFWVPLTASKTAQMSVCCCYCTEENPTITYDHQDCQAELHRS